MKKISENSAITFSAQLFIFGLGFITSIILARALGPEGRGIYSLIILIPAILVKFGSSGIEAANVYFAGSRRYEIGAIVSNALICALSLGFLLILLFWSISYSEILHNFLNANHMNIFLVWLAVLTVPPSLLLGFLNNILLGKEQIPKYNMVNMSRVVLNLIAIIILLLILRQGLPGAIFSHVFTVLGVTSFVILFVRKITKIKLAYNRSLLKDSFKYGLKVHFGNLAQFLNYRVDIFLIAFYLGPVAVGYYSIAVGMVERLWMLPAATATVMFPRISSLNSVEANHLTPRIARHSFLMVFILSLVLALLAKPLIKILFGSAFLPSVLPLLLLLPGVVALGGAKTLSADLAGRGQPQFGTYASFASLAVNVPLNLYLIPKWGISGAAFASSVGYILATLVVIGTFMKISKNSLRDILLIKKRDSDDYRSLLNKVNGRISRRRYFHA